MNVILENTLQIMSNHTDGGYSGFDILRRLLDKAMTGETKGNPIGIPEGPEHVASEEQERTVAELRALQQSMSRTHDRINPGLENDLVAATNPVIIVNYGGKDYLLDGNNRINYWSAKGDELKKLRVYHHVFSSKRP